MVPDIKFPTSEELPPEAQMYLDLWRLRYGHEWVRITGLTVEDTPKLFEWRAWELLANTDLMTHHYVTHTHTHLLKLKE